MKIKLFTFSYPFGNGEQFLHEEVDYLVRQGVNLTIVPFQIKGQQRELSAEVRVDTSMAKMLKQNSERRGYPLIWNFGFILKALFQHNTRNLSGLRDVIGFAHHGRIIKNWASQNIQNEDFLYTYWFERITYGLVEHLIHTKNTNVLVTRAHGYDLYEERRKHNFIPFRKKTLERLDQVFTISEDGRKYLIENYGFERKIHKSFLGIKDHENSDNLPDSVIRIVSCSSIIPLKRVDLIARVIKSFCKQNPSYTVEWNHFGGGKSGQLEGEINEVPSNLEVVLSGETSNKELLSFYNNNYIHLFINLSTSEGLPVSIMEAISFGIPVLAIDIGGVSEIVNDSTGKLLSPNFDQEEVNKAIRSILDNKTLRKSARKFFEENFVAEHNYQSFYTELKKLKA